MFVYQTNLINMAAVLEARKYFGLSEDLQELDGLTPLIDSIDLDSSSNRRGEENQQIVEAALNSFRDQWRKELSEERKQTVKEKVGCSSNQQADDCSVEDLARKSFMQGVEFEQKGNLYEAIRFYRKAVQLVPDIEFRFYESMRSLNKDRSETASIEDSSENEISRKDEDFSTEEDDLSEIDYMLRFQRYVAKKRAFCQPAKEQNAVHISKLPVEILLYIFRWVVSSELDIRSLDMCSMVCRGFYLCARDAEIWRLACLSLIFVQKYICDDSSNEVIKMKAKRTLNGWYLAGVWGVNCGSLTNYSSWREMYLKRPRLNFSGCYISKTSYIRPGENSFQDQFYRPWHVVEYFRYLRFFPEGVVLMLTTPDSPVPILGQLRSRNSRNPSVMVGHYRLHDDRITLIFHREQKEVHAITSNKRLWRRRNNTEFYEQTFHIELQVRPWKRRINWQLVWSRYCVLSKRGGAETTTDFEIISNKFPPFWFSRVKSYTAESDRLLS